MTTQPTQPTQPAALNRQRVAVSVIIPSSGRPRLLDRALASVLAQTFEDLEVLVVLDGPQEILYRELQSHSDPRLRVLMNATRLGVSATRNAGVSEATGEWVAFLDDDDEWFPDKLALQLAYAHEKAESNPVIGTRYITRSQHGDFVWPRRVPRPGEEISEYLFVREGFFCGEGNLLPSTVMARRQLLLDVPFNVDEPIHQDWGWLLECGHTPGVTFHCLEKALAVWNHDVWRERLSSARTVGHSLRWADSRRKEMTPRAYAAFVATIAASAPGSGNWKQLPRLWRTMRRNGAPGSKEYLLLLNNLIVPPAVRGALRGVFDRSRFRPGCSGSVSGPAAARAEDLNKQAARNRSLRILMLGPSLSQKGGIAAVEKAIIEHCPEDLWIRHVSTHEEGSAVWRLLVFLRAFFATSWRLFVWRPDVVHIHFSRKGSVWRKLIFVRIARLARRRVIMHAHGGRFQDFFDGLPRRLKKVVCRSLAGADGLIVLCESWRHYYAGILGTGGQRIFVLCNPVEAPRAVPDRAAVLTGDNGDTVVKLFFCGRLGTRKGTFDLIRAVSTLPDRIRKKTVLRLAGDGATEEARDLIDQLGLTDCIEVCGWLEDAAKNRMYRESDVFVLPSYREGVPMAMLEAMAWGLPVIVTPVGGIGEIVADGKNGVLVAPGAVDELRGALEKMITDEEYRLRLGENARETAMQFEAGAYAVRLKKVYESIVSGA